jgi:hypothetical protein
MEGLFKCAGKVKCFSTKSVLVRDRYGDEGKKQSYVYLPQLDTAIATLKEKRCRIIPSNLRPPTAKPSSPIRDITTHEIGVSPTPMPKCYKLVVKISGSKVRMLIIKEEESLEIFKPELERIFIDSPDSLITHPSYCMSGFGRCWLVCHEEVRLDFWFPVDNRISDVEAIELIEALLSSLNLSSEVVAPEAEIGSMSTLAPRDYKDVIGPLALTGKEVIDCCKVFVTKTKEITIARGASLNDVVLSAEVPTTNATHSGLMFFGPLGGAAGAGAVTRTGLPSLLSPKKP